MAAAVMPGPSKRGCRRPEEAGDAKHAERPMPGIADDDPVEQRQRDHDADAGAQRDARGHDRPKTHRSEHRELTPTDAFARTRARTFRGVSGYARNLEQTRPSFQNEALG